jgi:hypothetical protein
VNLPFEQIHEDLFNRVRDLLPGDCSISTDAFNLSITQMQKYGWQSALLAHP